MILKLLRAVFNLFLNHRLTQNSWGRNATPGDHLVLPFAQSTVSQSRLLKAMSSWVLSLSKTETPQLLWETSSSVQPLSQ